MNGKVERFNIENYKNMPEEERFLVLSIMSSLYNDARANDKRRFLAFLRKPSAITLGLAADVHQLTRHERWN
jgi:hypothetical protein